MSFDIAKFSQDGLNLLASLTAGKTLKIKNVYADTIEYLESDIEQSAAWWESTTDITMAKMNAVISGAGHQSDQARLTVKMYLNQNQVSNLTIKTIIVTACGVEGGVEGSEVVLCGVMDSNGVEVLYNASGVKLSTAVSIYFAFNAASSITVDTIANPDFALQSELDRFVSVHAIGDPSSGDTQHIKGEKEFEELLVDTNFGVTGACLISCPLETEDKIIVEQALKIGYNYIKGDKYQSNATPQLMIKNDDDADTKAAINFYKYKDESNSEYGILNFQVDNYSHSGDHYIDLCPTVYKDGDEKPSSVDIRFDTITLDGMDQIYPLTSNYTDLGTSLRKFKNVYATTVNGNLNGCIPSPSTSVGSTQTIPVGGMCLAYVSASANVNSLNVGGTFTITTPGSAYLTATNYAGDTWGGNKFLGAGTYKALSELASGSPTEGIVLVIRIS